MGTFRASPCHGCRTRVGLGAVGKLNAMAKEAPHRVSRGNWTLQGPAYNRQEKLCTGTLWCELPRAYWVCRRTLSIPLPEAALPQHA